MNRSCEGESSDCAASDHDREEQGPSSYDSHHFSSWVQWKSRICINQCQALFGEVSRGCPLFCSSSGLTFEGHELDWCLECKEAAETHGGHTLLISSALWSSGQEVLVDSWSASFQIWKMNWFFWAGWGFKNRKASEIWRGRKGTRAWGGARLLGILHCCNLHMERVGQDSEAKD